MRDTVIPAGLALWPAPAKLNLFLHITTRRQDGYHDLQTVFQLLDYGDALAFDIRQDSSIRRINPLGSVAAEDDLTVKAARLLQSHAGISAGVDIYLDKTLPMGGGLGGGSSDAATTLCVLNHLWQVGVTQTELMALGRSLGADVPVFVLGQSAWGEGVGEQLTPLSLPSRWFVVIHPPVPISTAALFADPELTRNCPPITIPDFLNGGGGNVFEPVVRKRYPEVAAALNWLGQYASARLTGTGSCIFAAVPNREQAEGILFGLPASWRGFIAKGINTSPLIEALAKG
jgi:4-diphosphocytidyl-2-C-methyl-D-erythritol kinase